MGHVVSFQSTRSISATFTLSLESLTNRCKVNLFLVLKKESKPSLGQTHMCTENFYIPPIKASYALPDHNHLGGGGLISEGRRENRNSETHILAVPNSEINNNTTNKISSWLRGLEEPDT